MWALAFAWAGLGLPAMAAPPGPDPLRTALRSLERDPSRRAEVIAAGRSVAGSFCVYCHGEDGNSAHSGIPNLADQNPAYLLSQIRQFQTGRREEDYAGVMQKVTKQISADDAVRIAVYYASARLTVRPAVNGAPVAAGRAIYQSRCVSCHGRDGMGRGEYPRVAGQEPGYVTRTLRHFRERAVNRPSLVMSAETGALTDPEIASLSAYLAQMPLTQAPYYQRFPAPGFAGDH